MGINDELQQIKDLLKENQQEVKKKKDKKFKFPFGTKVSKSQAKKNYVTIMKINENGTVNIIKRQIQDQTIMEDDIPRLASTDYVLRYKNNPLLILPSWSVKPFSPSEQYEKSLNDGSNTKGYSILLARMIKEQINTKKPMGNWIKWVIGLGLVGIIIYALMTGGGG